MPPLELEAAAADRVELLEELEALADLAAALVPRSTARRMLCNLEWADKAQRRRRI